MLRRFYRLFGLALAIAGLVLTPPPHGTAMAQPVIDRFTKSQNPQLFRVVKRKIARLVAEADQLIKQDRFEQAEPLLFEALDLQLSIESPGHPDALTYANNYAYVIKQLGWLSEAKQVYATVFERADRSLGKTHEVTLAVLFNYAGVLEALEQTSEAEPFYREALFRRREALGRNHPETLQSLAALASNLCDQGRCDRALPLADQALSARRRILGADHPDTLLSQELLAIVHWRLGNLSTAESQFTELIERMRAGFDDTSPRLASSLNLYGGFLAEIDRLEDALALFTEAEAIAGRSSKAGTLGTLQYTGNAAAALFKLGRTREAIPGFRTIAAKRAELLPLGHPDTVKAQANLSLALLDNRQSVEALEPVEYAIEWTRKRATSKLADDLKERTTFAQTLVTRQAIEKLYADALWAQRSDADTAAAQLAGQALIALQYASTNPASDAVQEAAALRFADRNNRSDLVRQREALLAAWSEKDSESITLIETGANDEKIAENKRGLVEIRAEIAAIERQLREELPEYFSIVSDQVVRLPELRAVLGSDEAVVMLVPTPRGTHAMAVTDGGIEWSRSDWTGSTIAAKVDELRQGLEVTGGGRLPVFDFALAHELYAELIAPVESALEGKKRVYVVADGALSRLPLGVLLAERLEAEAVDAGDAESAADPVRGTLLGGAPSGAASTANDPADFARAQWLADRYALVNLPSLQSLVFIRTFGLTDEDIEGSGYTGFGDPILARHASQNGSRSAGLGGSVDAATMLSRGGSNEALMNPASLKQMASLPGTKRELEQVSQLLGASDTSLFLGEAMTEPAIRNADLSKTRILHLATHGLTSEEGGRLGDLAEPGLVFTPPERSSEADDGYLAASEVVGLNLTLADWVILSACNTAAPSGKAGETGLSGLAQAFFYAGAESLLVSHWPVFDSVAPILTAETLARAQQGTPRAEAFQQAMQAVRETNPHPAAWAPFVLVGEGR